MSLGRAGEGVTLSVVDDGQGAAGTAGAGLSGLSERVTALGGRLTAGPAEGNGFRLVAELPTTPVAQEPLVRR
jgi:two-component system sensor histidine kinase DesK